MFGVRLLFIYPSNRLEDLAALAAQVIKHRPSEIFEATTLLVPNPGMQHWLSLELSKHLHVAMNFNCPLPTRFIWDTCRQILGADHVPKQSPYKREIMTWRIYDIVANARFVDSQVYDLVAQYWESASNDEEKQYRQFNFAQQLADVFEQYMVFRPQWLLNWENNQGTQKTPDFAQAHHQNIQIWQKWFWQQLVKTQPIHPVHLQFKAMQHLKEQKPLELPRDIYLFAINTISPIYLSFFDAIGQHTNVHFFQLNPCVNYWGDAQSDLALAKLQRKQAYDASLQEEHLHPLLRNLGQQGRDLVNLVNDLPHQEIAAFSSDLAPVEVAPSLLSVIQHDIFSGQENSFEQQISEPDNSIVVHACHNAVRELQVLKDCLLDRFEKDSQLRPKDILVMCPSIETYSPYIKSIFTQANNTNSYIPVSISDRKPLESESLIVGFLHLLKLHNSRFDATSVIDFISIESVALKFALSADDIALCALWMKQTNIHWGIDAAHQSKVLQDSSGKSQHTWHWGVKRLLTSLTNAINDSIVADVATINVVEGNNAQVLGKFLFALEQIELSLIQLSGNKPLEQWSQLLHEVLLTFFNPTSADTLANGLLQNAIAEIAKQQLLGEFSTPVDIKLVLVAMENALNIPETRSQFLSGNVTFCSMLPMRSIPFKVIAILGLNHSDFPRQDIPFEINLIQASGTKVGDRSRRGDDRYLFLESLISARQYLHLSYQYRKVTDNSSRQPSLILQMLIDYCDSAYSKNALPLVEHPLHPFSEMSFLPRAGFAGSYDKDWWQQYIELKTIQENIHAVHLQAKQHSKQILNIANSAVSASNQTSEAVKAYSAHDLASFLKDSIGFYAKRVLGIYLQKPEPRDFQPQYALNRLTEHKIKQDLYTRESQLDSQHLNLNLAGDGQNQVITHWRLAGELPFLVGLEDTLEQYTQEMQLLRQAVSHNKVADGAKSNRIKGEISCYGIQLLYDIEYIQEQGVRAVKLNSGAPSLQHIFGAWLEYLLVLQHTQNTSLSMGIFFVDAVKAKTSDESSSQFCVYLYEAQLAPQTTAKEALDLLLKYFSQGLQSPLLLDINLAKEVLQYETIDAALHSKSLQLKWSEAADEKSGKAAIGASLPNPYFDFLIGAMPEFSESSLQVFFDCFSPIEEFQITEVINAAQVQGKATT